MALLFDSWLVELIAVFVALFSGLYLFLALKYQHWKRKGIPYLEPSFPFGNVTDMALRRETVGDAFTKMYWKLDGHKVGGIYQIHVPTLLIRDPEFVKTILVKDFTHFHDHGILVNEDDDPLAAHLFSLEGIKWKHLRYKLTPTFTSGKMKMMFQTINECGKELKAHLGPIAARKETIEIKDVLAKFSTDVIATCAFGIQSNCLKNPQSEFRKYGKKNFDLTLLRSFKILMIFLLPDVAKFFNAIITPTDVTKFFLGIVRETLEYREKFQVTRNDFMQLLINIRNKKTISDETEHEDQTNDNAVEEKVVEQNMYDVNGMTVEQVAAQAFVFFLAGFETSSTTMSFCLYELALNKDIQDRLRDEIDSVMADQGDELTYEAIMKMEYMDMVVSETMRKYPPLPTLMRVCTKDYKLPESGVDVKKGTPVVIPVYALQHDPQYYPDPEKFDPERFTEEAKSNRHHYVYLPFGEGPRICIGSRFGLLQTKVGIASVLSAYQVDLCRKSTPVPLSMDEKSFIMSSKDGINLKLTSRMLV